MATAKEVGSIQGGESAGNFLHVALDLVEGMVAGGIIGDGAYIIASAVASLPSPVITAAEVGPLAVIAGALAFAGVALHQIRKRYM